MKRTTLLAFALGASALGLGLVACGSSDTTETPGGDTSDVGQPPARPTGAPTDKVQYFAVDTISFGEDNAWKKIGYNLDKKVSTATSKDVCTKADRASDNVHLDGERGIDNAFGNIIVSVLRDLPGLEQPSGTVNAELKKGTFSVLLETKGLAGDPAQSADGLSGQLFVGAELKNPTFTTADKWPVRPELLNGGTVESGSKVKFTNAYIAEGTFVSGDRTNIALDVSFGSVAVKLNIRNALVTFKTPSGSNLAEGVIAGVVQTSDVLGVIDTLAPTFDPQFCDPNNNLVKTIKETIAQASDIMADGTNAPGTPCDAISIGLGFTAKEIGGPGAVVAPTQGSNQCADGGT